ncbi:polysaccharide deacetylase family protein [Geomonas agri]|uniref:polysaccharide deacetylase family protein n=1 Tax=Geomonas agri TaxID=2873702 RepID=UPI001CD21BDD|nr:polysaccharide deacetylase family protein [Geomonas agri]
MLLDAIHMGVSPLLMASRWVRNRLSPPVLILLYHRVTRLEHDPQLLAVSPENFRAQMRYLKENFALARLDDDWERIPKPAVVVTFDDGYADNALEALPILEELQVPATFFVATELLGSGREFWWDDVERLLLTERTYPPALELQINGAAKRWDTAMPQQRARCYQELLPLLRRELPQQREDHLDKLRSWAGAGKEGRATHRSLSGEELRTLAASPQVTLGAHTVTHSSLSTLPASHQREEIAASRARLEELTGKKAEVFSYPFGTRRDYTGATVSVCRELGFARTCSAFPGQWRAGTDVQQLPRQVVRDWDLATFKKQLSRFWIS